MNFELYLFLSLDGLSFIRDKERHNSFNSASLYKVNQKGGKWSFLLLPVVSILLVCYANMNVVYI